MFEVVKVGTYIYVGNQISKAFGRTSSLSINQSVQKMKPTNWPIGNANAETMKLICICWMLIKVSKYLKAVQF